MADSVTQQVQQTTMQSSLSSPAHRDAARGHVEKMFRPGELVWLVGETYDANLGMWQLEILRLGGFARWAHQRYRYDEAADVLYFLGETTLSDEAFRVARERGALFPKA